MVFNNLFYSGNTSDVKNVNVDEEYIIPLKDIHWLGEDLEAQELTPTSINQSTATGQSLDLLGFERDLPILVLGETGSGKTSAITTLARQINPSRNEPLIILDYKGDYRDYGLYNRQSAHILSYQNSTANWNIFEEIEYDRDFMTMASLVFPNIAFESGNRDESWWKKSRNVFEACLRFTYDKFNSPSNEDLVNTITRPQLTFGGDRNPDIKPEEFLYNNFNGSSDPNIAQHASLLDTSTEAGTNTYQFLTGHVRDLFIGDFKKPGDFSVTEYIKNPNGKTLVISLEDGDSDIVTPMARLIIDLGISIGRNSSNQTYYILDEIDDLDPLTKIRSLVTKGRSEGAQVFIGIQSVSQLIAEYGEDDANTITQNCPQQLLMKTSDTDFVSERIGTVQLKQEKTEAGFQKMQSVLGFARGKKSAIAAMGLMKLKDIMSEPEYVYEEVNPLEEADIQFGKAGQGVIVRRNGWLFCRLAEWGELSTELQHKLAGRDRQQNPHTGTSSIKNGGQSVTPSSPQNSTADSPSQNKSVDKSKWNNKKGVTLSVLGDKFDVELNKKLGKVIRKTHVQAGGDPNDARKVHREHILFEQHPTVDGRIVLVPVGETNPTHVDGKKIPKNELKSITEGDVIHLGKSVRVTVESLPK